MLFKITDRTNSINLIQQWLVNIQVIQIDLNVHHDFDLCVPLLLFCCWVWLSVWSVWKHFSHFFYSEGRGIWWQFYFLHGTALFVIVKKHLMSSFCYKGCGCESHSSSITIVYCYSCCRPVPLTPPSCWLVLTTMSSCDRSPSIPKITGRSSRERSWSDSFTSPTLRTWVSLTSWTVLRYAAYRCLRVITSDIWGIGSMMWPSLSQVN